MPYAIDLFSGAGGFSEGILQTGFNIVFSSDKSPMVEETYTNRHEQLGFKQGIDTHFELADIKDLSAELILEKINSLKYGNIFKQGSIDAVFGGPPCQGFSRLGKRDSADPRNMLFHEYLKIIRDIRPKYVVMENVTGILDMQMLDFPSVLDHGYYDGQNLVKTILEQEFKGLEYTLLEVKVLNAADFGVPQQRNRVVFLAYRNDVAPINYPSRYSKEISVYDALGDLYTNRKFSYSTKYSIDSLNGRTPHSDSGTPVSRSTVTNMEISKHEQSVIDRFSLYLEGENRRKASSRLKVTGINLKKKTPDLFYESLFSLNLSSNVLTIKSTLEKLNLLDNQKTTEKWLKFTNRQLYLLYRQEFLENKDEFNRIIKSLSLRLGADFTTTLMFWEAIKGKLNQYLPEDAYQEKLKNGDIDEKIIEVIFTKKGIRTRLNSKSISPTMVTLPDDYIHPFFDRILTVREMARLQSFDDSFEFLGKRTTGGHKRALETPQYTQVGNAVPPLLAKAIADEVMKAVNLNNNVTTKL